LPPARASNTGPQALFIWWRWQGYYAYSPTLPGCFSNGPTIEDCRRNIREAIELHIESLSKRSQGIPQAEKLVHIEAISIGLP